MLTSATGDWQVAVGDRRRNPISRRRKLKGFSRVNAGLRRIDSTNAQSDFHGVSYRRGYQPSQNQRSAVRLAQEQSPSHLFKAFSSLWGKRLKGASAESRVRSNGYRIERFSRGKPFTRQ